MKGISNTSARVTYNRLSRWYDFIAGSAEQKLKDTALRRLKPRPDETILEIGCGTGQTALSLARAVAPVGRIYALDISEGMLSIARTKAVRVELADRIVFIHGDGRILPFKPVSLDAVFMTFTLELFSDFEISVVLREVQRILCNSGRLCVAAMSREEPENLMLRAYGWAHRKLPDWVDCRPIYVEEVVKSAGFHLDDVMGLSLWGLPVKIVTARRS